MIKGCQEDHLFCLNSHWGENHCQPVFPEHILKMKLDKVHQIGIDRRMLTSLLVSSLSLIQGKSVA